MQGQAESELDEHDLNTFATLLDIATALLCEDVGLFPCRADAARKAADHLSGHYVTPWIENEILGGY